jgi:hypothetical protein
VLLIEVVWKIFCTLLGQIVNVSLDCFTNSLRRNDGPIQNPIDIFLDSSSCSASYHSHHFPPSIG